MIFKGGGKNIRCVNIKIRADKYTALGIIIPYSKSLVMPDKSEGEGAVAGFFSYKIVVIA